MEVPMRNLVAWLGAAALVILAFAHSASAANDPLKPYVVMMLDTSGSMDDPTGSGPPTCGGTDSKLNHARCAINKIANSYGDMVFALGRFRETGAGRSRPRAPSTARRAASTAVRV